MFLSITQQRNPSLVEYASWLHHRQEVAPNTYVIDADTVAENARLTAEAGARNGLVLNVMTKQYGRTPRVSQLIRDAGLTRFVAVDIDEARVLWRAGLWVAHVGHLVGCSAYDLTEVLEHRPAVVTVFDVEQARRLDRAAGELGVRQNLLLRLYDPELGYYPGQHGGFSLADLQAALPALAQLENVRVAGVTAHPTLMFDYDTGTGGRTDKLDLLRAGAAVVAEATGESVEINAPGVSCIATMGLLRAEGVTSAEPGSALTGTTPLHAFGEQPEVPAIVYVSEVSHSFGRRVFTFGGGFYARGHVKGAALARDGKMPATYLPAVDLPAEAIDYYGELTLADGVEVRTGDTAIYAFRNQVFVTRARVAVVEGLHSGSQPRITGVYDSRGALLSGR
ncbi:MAG: putative amino acid racemase [Dactylosporangium sp.]|nr:putative amino acid racemase [Dactylosporangium sp.]